MYRILFINKNSIDTSIFGFPLSMNCFLSIGRAGRESPKLGSWRSDPRLLESTHPKTYSLPVAKLLQTSQQVYTNLHKINIRKDESLSAATANLVHSNSMDQYPLPSYRKM